MSFQEIKGTPRGIASQRTLTYSERMARENRLVIKRTNAANKEKQRIADEVKRINLALKEGKSVGGASAEYGQSIGAVILMPLTGVTFGPGMAIGIGQMNQSQKEAERKRGIQKVEENKRIIKYYQQQYVPQRTTVPKVIKVIAPSTKQIPGRVIQQKIMR